MTMKIPFKVWNFLQTFGFRRVAQSDPKIAEAVLSQYPELKRYSGVEQSGSSSAS